MPWLIEHNIQFLSAPQYLRVDVESPHQGASSRVSMSYDKHWETAIQFARKKDAEAFIYLHPSECLNARATEHEFVGNTAPGPMFINVPLPTSALPGALVEGITCSCCGKRMVLACEKGCTVKATAF